MPIFETQKHRGALLVGNTPADVPVYDNTYDLEVLALLPLYFLRYAVVEFENPPIWYTYAEAITAQIYLETVSWGPFFANQWALDYAIPTPAEWPTYAQGITDDGAKNLGPVWMQGWYDWLSPQLTYDEMVDTVIGSIWNAKLDTTAFADPLGGTITTPGDGYRYHAFTDTVWDAFYAGTVGTLSVDALFVGGGGGGGRYGSNTDGGGGGAGEYVALTSYSAVDRCPVSIGPGGTGVTPTNGFATSFDGSSASGGGRGGSIAAGTHNGAAGGSGGGGSVTDAGVLGTGGAGVATAGGLVNAGGTGVITRAGGGGGSAAAGANGVAGDAGNGGAGTTWLDGVAYAGGGGGGGGGGTGGSGGGGNGASGGNNNGSAATANRGSGGGGSSGTGTPGTGSAGIVKIRYPYP